jgi:tetratricopeptide (TPR) repeat protein
LKALAALDGWLLNAPASPSAVVLHAWATRAHVLGGLGRWDDACQQLGRLVEALPDHAIHHFNWGYALQHTGAWGAAEKAFRRAVQLSPRLDLAWYGLGDVLWAQGQWAAAEQAWVRQSELQPFCPDGLVRLVCLHADRGQRSTAEGYLDRLKAFDPQRAMALEITLDRVLVTRPGACA